jgi:hypothetical protein
MAWPLAVEILPKVVVEPPYISGLIWPAISRWLDGVRLSLARHHGEEAIHCNTRAATPSLERVGNARRARSSISFASTLKKDVSISNPPYAQTDHRCARLLKHPLGRDLGHAPPSQRLCTCAVGGWDRASRRLISRRKRFAFLASTSICCMSAILASSRMKPPRKPVPSNSFSTRLQSM